MTRFIDGGKYCCRQEHDPVYVTPPATLNYTTGLLGNIQHRGEFVAMAFSEILDEVKVEFSKYSRSS